ncbi:hypothetical protein [Thiorhodovibrio frisius]|uniref:Uncharacterized protein n=1 Tax=Thiorhodovibrio frisius TaxID=631362 RepID=H8YVH2_9GAMM|nr:hypothetical protein [Thiorhodovibrio frisius]EIC23912.1 hypothetical protein Thi970DRAFT_00047 [Thiorhodovibrio frisius]WPL23164.1 hypothetical protein Thiofri_03347 [Thiorhodovibrio frisius]
MTFLQQPRAYEKTALADLQGAWMTLREAVVSQFGFPNSDTLLFHIDEAMSWESVRNLNTMKSSLVLIRNIAAQAQAPTEVTEGIDDVQDCFEEAVSAIADGSVT